MKRIAKYRRTFITISIMWFIISSNSVNGYNVITNISIACIFSSCLILLFSYMNDIGDV